MDPIVARCGYRCDLCLSHETNLKSDEDKHRFSEALAKYYDCRLPPEQVRPCKGCLSAAEAPDPNCEVYPCVGRRGLANCGQCPEFGCDKLKTRMDVVEACLRKHPSVPQEDYRQFFHPYLSRPVLTAIQRSRQDPSAPPGPRTT